MSAPHLFPHWVADPALRRKIATEHVARADAQAVIDARDAKQRLEQQRTNDLRQARGGLHSAMIDCLDVMRMPVEDPSRRRHVEAADTRLKSAQLQLAKVEGKLK